MAKTTQIDSDFAPDLSGRLVQKKTFRTRSYGGFSRKGLLWVLCLLLVGMAGLFGFYKWVTDPQRLAGVAGAAMEQAIGGTVRVESAELAWSGTVTLSGVELSDPGQPGDAGRIFFAPTILLEQSLWDMIRGGMDVRKVVLVRPRFSVSEDVQTGRLNLQGIKRRARPKGKRSAAVPEVVLFEGRVMFGRVDHGSYKRNGVIGVTGWLRADPSRRGVYLFDLRQTDSGQENDPVLNGEFEVEKSRFSARLEHFAFEGPQRGILPGRVRKWWDELEPEGAVPAVEFGYDPAMEGGFYARVELVGIEISLPDTGRKMRLRVESGRLTLMAEAVEFERLKGKLYGVDYEVNGRARGLSGDSAFNLDVIASGPIPTDPEQIGTMPRAAVKQLKRFDAKGDFRLAASLWRSPGMNQMKWKGRIDLVDVDARDQQLPYPMKKVNGGIAFSDERVELIDLEGSGNGGSRIRITGTIEPPVEGAEVHVAVDARRLPVDADLLEAISPQQLAIVKKYFDVGAYDMLVEKGLIRGGDVRFGERVKQEVAATGPSVAGAEQKVDRVVVDLVAEPGREKAGGGAIFEMGGAADFRVEIEHGYGKEKPWVTTRTIDLAGLRAVSSYWPYPLRVKEGKIVVVGSQIEVKDVRVEGLSGGELVFSGRYGPGVGGESRLMLDVKMKATGVPVDGFLLASIPDRQAELVRGFGVEGKLDAEGVISEGRGGSGSFEIIAKIAGGRAKPFDGSYGIEDLKGRLKFNRQHVEIEEMEGRHGESVLRLSGDADWKGGRSEMRLKLRGSGMRFEDALLGLVPAGQEGLRRAWASVGDRGLRGGFDLDLDYQAGSVEGENSYRLVINPSSMGMDYEGERVEMKEMNGSMVIDPKGLVLERLGGRLGVAKLGVSGVVAFGEEARADLTFDLEADRLEEEVKRVLPAAVREAIDGMSLNGAYRVEGGRLKIKKEGGGSVMELDARIGLKEVSGKIGAEVKDLVGEMKVAYEGASGDEAPKWSLGLAAERAWVMDRLVSPLKVEAGSLEGGREGIGINKIEGGVYGGTVTGTGAVYRGGKDNGGYQLQLELRDSVLEPVLHPGDDRWLGAGAGKASAERLGGGQKDWLRGTLSAGLTIEGSLTDPLAKRGRGGLRIKGANLYQLPLALSLLQIINLTWPQSRAFDRAGADYVIEGDKVVLESVKFESPHLTVAGSGTMGYTTHELNLLLYSQNSAGQQFGPLGDLAAMLKDELVGIGVKGTLEKPVATMQSFSGIRRSWEKVFGTDEVAPKKGAPLSSGQP